MCWTSCRSGSSHSGGNEGLTRPGYQANRPCTRPAAARDSIRSGRPAEGKEALYSTGPRQVGTVVVRCSACEARTRINLTDLSMRFVTVTVWLPIRKHSHWMRCPACGQRTWCHIGWQS